MGGGHVWLGALAERPLGEQIGEAAKAREALQLEQSVLRISPFPVRLPAPDSGSRSKTKIHLVVSNGRTQLPINM